MAPWLCHDFDNAVFMFGRDIEARLAKVRLPKREARRDLDGTRLQRKREGRLRALLHGPRDPIQYSSMADLRASGLMRERE